MELAGVQVVPYTLNWGEAEDWHQAGFDVVARHNLYGHSGEGIEVVIGDQKKEDWGDVPEAPLYTKYIKKKSEYRVHVVGEVTDIQKKRRRTDVEPEDCDYKVRNHSNGWVYCRENLNIPKGINELAISAVRALNLDFGAVDIIWNEHHNQMYVLEVNTAPGLEGATIDFYADNLRGLI